jgi:hypothetical protein
MLENNSKTIECLEQQIAVGRRNLQTLWDAHGCTDDVVLAASIELDKLINQYHKMTRFY